MIYFADSECWEQYYLFCAVDEDGNKYCYTSPNDITDFINGLTEEDILVTKNGFGYDFPMWRKVMSFTEELSDFTSYMRSYNDAIIQGGKRFSPRKVYKSLRAHFPFIPFDVQELWNMYASLKRAVGAKGYQSIMDSPIPFDYAGPFDKELKELAKKYCISDCWATKFIYEHPQTQKEIKSRKILEEIYGVDVLSLGRPRAVEEILQTKFTEATELEPYEAKRVYYKPPTKLNFRKILQGMGKRSTIKFKSKHLEKFQNILLNYERELNAGSTHVSVFKNSLHDEKGRLISFDEQLKLIQGNKFDMTINYCKKTYRFKEGGLHIEYGEERPVYHASDTHALAELDFDAYYPGIVLEFDIFPKWIQECGFNIKEFYQNIVDKNLSEKYSKKPDWDLRESYKILSNLYYGKYGEDSSIVGDERLRLKTGLTGQLLALKLIEMSEREGFEVIYANTDGIVVRYHRGSKDKLERMCENISSILKINVKPNPITSMYMDNANSYVWIREGKVKTKKEYSNYQNWQNPTLKFPVVPIAVQRYLLFGTPVEKTIKEWDVLNDFCEIKAAGRKYKMQNGKRVLDEVGKNTLIPSNKVISPTVRYYHSTDGEALVTIFKDGTVRKHQLANKISLALDFSELPKLPENIDYDFYIRRAEKLIGDWEPSPQGVLNNDDLPF